MKILSIDPSIKDVGYAQLSGLIRNPDGTWDNSKAEWSWGHWEIGSLNLMHRFREVVEWIYLDCGGLNEEEGDWLVMEWPTYYGSAKGQIAAQMDYTIPLAGVCAYIAGFYRMSPMNVHLLTAVEWKGNVSKEVTRHRFFKTLGVTRPYKINHNAVDAVMLLHTFCKRRKIAWEFTNVKVELRPED